MVRENRYVVFKKSDLDKVFSLVEPEAKERFQKLCVAVTSLRKFLGKDPLDCVVVEHDWPEYEPTWKAIEKRVDGITVEDSEDHF